MRLSNIIKKSILIFAILCCYITHSQNNDTFKVTLDAGHGGNDPGCQKYGYKEKDVTLSVVKKIGDLLERQPKVKVNYTRETDVLIDLAERGYIANRNNANIFVSVHCNASKNTGASGTETFVMGLKKNSKSMEISRRENEVITLEKDYKTKYKGFDPNSPESYIGQTLMQEESLANSISLASKIQEKFTIDLNKKDRGVHQDVFMVLHRATMPRVLIEIGFLTNQEEGEILSSDDGQDQIAQAIANAILCYKKEYFDGDEDSCKNKFEYTALKERTKTVQDEPIKEEIVEKQDAKSDEVSGKIYKIQLCASNKKLKLQSKNFKGMKEISVEKDGNLYKYYAGNETDMDEIKQILKQAKAKGYKTAFVVTFVDGKSQ